MKRWRVVIGLSLLAVGCKGLADGAKEEFSKQFTCPPARIEVRERADIDIYDLEHPHPSIATPPPEVAADPGRLAQWNKERDAKIETERGYTSSHHLFEVRGCDHVVLYNCNKPGRGSTPGSYYMCHDEKSSYPPGTPAW